MTTREASEVLGVGIWAVRKAIQRGQLRADWVFGRHDVSFDAVEDYRRDHLGKQGRRK